MMADISGSGNAANRPGPKSTDSRIPSVVFALIVSACAIYAAAHGPTLLRAAHHLKAEQIKHEDEVFCEAFHMPPGSESFTTCVSHLAEIRRLHGQRVGAEAAGIF